MTKSGPKAPTLLAHDRVGMVVDGRYRIDEMLRDGAMGSVYRATQLSIDRTVALKVVDRRQITGEGNIQRFMSEARIISEMTHPNIVRLFDFGQDDAMDLLFLVMEFIEGPSLELLLEERGRLKQDFAVEMVYQICGALTDPHASGVIHRDLKPENLLLLPMSDGSVQLKVVDFGVARVLSTDKRVTAKGIICGTPWYMAPEQAEQQGEVDARADLYALGVIFYQMLCGCPPFDADGAIQVILKQIRDKPTPLSEFMEESELASGLEDLIMELLSKKARDRPESALVFRRKLEEVMDEHRFDRVRVSTDGDMLERFERWTLPVVESARQALVFNPGPPRAIDTEHVSEPIEDLLPEEERAANRKKREEAALTASSSDSPDEEALPPKEEATKEGAAKEDVAKEEVASPDEKGSDSSSAPLGEEESAPRTGTDQHGAFLAPISESLDDSGSSALKSSGSFAPKIKLPLGGETQTKSKKSRAGGGPPPPRVDLFEEQVGTVNIGRAFVADKHKDALANAPTLGEDPLGDSAPQKSQRGTMTFAPPPISGSKASKRASSTLVKLGSSKDSEPEPVHEGGELESILDGMGVDPVEPVERVVEDNADGEGADERETSGQHGTARFSASVIQTRKAGKEREKSSHINGRRQSSSAEDGPKPITALSVPELDEAGIEEEPIPQLSTAEVKAKRPEDVYGRVDVGNLADEIQKREKEEEFFSSDAEEDFEADHLFFDDAHPEEENRNLIIPVLLFVVVIVGLGIGALISSNKDKKSSLASKDDTNITRNASDTTPDTKDGSSLASVGNDLDKGGDEKSVAKETTPESAPTETTPASETSPESETTPVAETTPAADAVPAEKTPEKEAAAAATKKKIKRDKPKETKKETTPAETNSGEDKVVDDKLKKNMEWLRKH